LFQLFHYLAYWTNLIKKEFEVLLYQNLNPIHFLTLFVKSNYSIGFIFLDRNFRRYFWAYLLRAFNNGTD